MHSRRSGNRLSGMVTRPRISNLMLAIFATFATIYVAGRLWQDSQSRVHLIKELDRITGQGQSAISVDDTLKIIACREQHKKLSALETELAAAQQEGFLSRHSTGTSGNQYKKRPLLVMGLFTAFGRKKNRDAIRKAWMRTGVALKKKRRMIRMLLHDLSLEKVSFFEISNQEDSLDGGIGTENRQSNDFIVLDDLVEAPEETSKKAKLFFAYTAEKWDAEFYAKVKDDIYVYIDPLAATLAAHLDKPCVYIGCMKSGEVFLERGHKWYEPDWWKFGEKKSYFRHAFGGMYVVSQALAKFISINRSILCTYAHDDVIAGSWFIGLDVKHIDESKFCCSSWSSGAICAGV